MLKIISAALFSLFATLVWANEDTDPETRCGKESGGEITVQPKGNGAAQVTLSRLTAAWKGARPPGALYCLAKIGEGWAGNTDNTVFDFKKALYCAPPQNDMVKIDFKWPGYKPGLVDTIGFVPVSVYPDGRIYCWDQKPRPPYPDQNEVTRMKSRITGNVETVVSLHLVSNGQVIQAMSEEAQLLKD